MHAVDVSAGRALPAKTITIAPVPGLVAPPPHPAPLLGQAPSRALTPAEKLVVRQTYEEVRGWAAARGHHSSCLPVPMPKVVPIPQAQSQSQSARPPPQAQATGAPTTPATDLPLPPQKLLADVPVEERGKRWQARQKLYVPWNPSMSQLQEARRLLTGEEEWATPKPVFMPEGDPLCKGPSPSMRWVCGHGSCHKLVSSFLDGRGHYQSTHLGRQVTNPLCFCGLPFNSCMTLANHLDIWHNINHAMVARREPMHT